MLQSLIVGSTWANSQLDCGGFARIRQAAAMTKGSEVAASLHSDDEFGADEDPLEWDAAGQKDVYGPSFDETTPHDPSCAA